MDQLPNTIDNKVAEPTLNEQQQQQQQMMSIEQANELLIQLNDKEHEIEQLTQELQQCIENKTPQQNSNFPKKNEKNEEKNNNENQVHNLSIDNQHNLQQLDQAKDEIANLKKN